VYRGNLASNWKSLVPFDWMKQIVIMSSVRKTWYKLECANACEQFRRDPSERALFNAAHIVLSNTTDIVKSSFVWPAKVVSR
jgi:hypothetical protein